MRKYVVMATAAMVLAAGSFAAARAAEIVFLEGNVQVQPVDEKEWKKAEKGMTVAIGDSVRTARHSRVDIALDSEKKNTIRLEEKTLVVLNSASADTIDRLDLAKGRVYSNLEGIKAGLSFEVNTPSAVAGVRGSSYMVYVEKDEDEVAALKDTVYLRSFDADNNQLADTMLPEGFKTFIARFDLPSTFLQISRDEFIRSDSIREHIAAHAEGREIQREERLGGEQQGMQPPQSRLESTVEQTVEQNQVVDVITDLKDLQQDKNSEERIQDFTEPSHYEPPQEEGGHEGW